MRGVSVVGSVLVGAGLLFTIHEWEKKEARDEKVGEVLQVLAELARDKDSTAQVLLREDAVGYKPIADLLQYDAQVFRALGEQVAKIKD